MPDPLAERMTAGDVPRLTYTVPEAAELLGVGRGSAYEAARTGELPTVKIGRRLLVPRHRLERLLGLPKDIDPAGNGVDGRNIAGEAASDDRRS